MRRSLLCLGVLLVCLLHEFGGTVSTVSEARGENSGSLSVFNRAGAAVGACPLQHTAVLAEISGILSSVSVSQRFGNPYKEPIEAVYTFPLPHNAAVNEMTIRVGERVIRGVVKRKEAVQAVRQWKYAPTLLNGSPIPVIATVAISFRRDGKTQSSLDVAVALLIERVRARAAADATEYTFFRDGKAELELTLQALTEEVPRRLAALGFEISSESRSAHKVVGRMPVEKVELLLEVKALQFIAPHRQPPM